MRLDSVVIGTNIRIENAAIYGAVEVILLDWCVPVGRLMGVAQSY